MQLNVLDKNIMPYYKCTFIDKEIQRHLSFETYALSEEDAKSKCPNPGSVTRVSRICRKWNPFSDDSLAISKIITMSRLFAEMLKDFSPLSNCIEEAMNVFRKDKRMFLTLSNIQRMVNTGSYLSDAFSVHQTEFGPFVAMIIAAGEKSESLQKSFQEICVQLERTQKLNSSIIQNLLYPGALTAMAIGVSSSLARNVLPELVENFADSGAKLPIATRIFVYMVNFASYWKLHVIASVALFAVIKVALRFKAPRIYIDKLYMKIPLIGNLKKLRNSYVFLKSLDMAFAGKMTVLDGLQLARQSLDSNNAAYEVDAAVSNLRNGVEFYRVMGNLTFISTKEKVAIEVAERSANIPPTITNLAETRYKNLSLLMRNIENSIQPVSIALIGLFFAFIVAATVAPMAKMYLHMI